ncbi:glutamine--fructose-6-phosphate transaminase [Novosphingobium sp. CF614]|uniref:SIS domain-containing protein n=1 Tax=Novosphingobium sp. CF614 TaxID=1884364 RepID=UPI0008EAD86B|nr:SIS domain-containing protein [Novosphingobium sp. CF614]SFF72835.1 glutamine--fructose-6-phosphate transaminase [Novosphingobium sp. CF614]
MTSVELHAGQSAMRREAAEAGKAVIRFLAHNEANLKQLADRLRASPPNVVVTCARGSSDHAATFGKYLIETRLGVPVSSAAPSVASVFSSEMRQTGALLIAVSQSGRSPDLVATVERYKAAGAFVVAIVNQPDSPMEALADCFMPLCAGPELSVAATKSFVVSLSALAAITAWWSDDAALKLALADLPALLDRAHDLDWSAMVEALVDARNLLVVGRGYGLAVAQEAALKLKETCGLHAEAFSSAEVRHGPMAIVGKDFPVLALATSDNSGDDVRTLADEFAGRGARVILADCSGGAGQLPAFPAHPVIEPIVLIQSFYGAAERLARARGLEPDSPPFLRKVTETR